MFEIIFVALITIGIIRIDTHLIRMRENDERIISRLDTIIKKSDQENKESRPS